MDSEIIANAIRDPTEHAASEVMSNITPDIVSGIMPSIFGFTINGSQSSEVVAEQTLDQILTVVETKVLGEGVDFVIDKFGDRIIDMLTGETMLSIFERVAMMIVSGTSS
ncbi:MAG: hypothetical protein ACT4NJ_06855 [Nitrosopumilaceae archaeon]|jgi:hypothetical protein|nr:MAG: Uncharacterized protein XU09_C0007G0132 [Thaumarchaeota archaeon CSP1-1]